MYFYDYNHRPRHLYMYFTAVNACKFLEKHNIKFSKPTLFNDPFECHVDFNRSLVTSGFSKSYENGKLNERDTEGLQDSVNSQLSKRKIACFSEENDSVLMWAYYAEGQRGICIEFDTEKDPLFFSQMKKVKYKSELPTINSLHSQAYEDIITTKCKKWEHEKEWRVIKDDLYGCFFPINPQAITSVIFGCSSVNWEYNKNENCVYEQIFKNLQRPEYSHIKLKCMLLVQEEYRLKCLEMPFFVIQETSHTLMIYSLNNSLLNILKITEDGSYKDVIYKSVMNKWGKTEITLPNGNYYIGDDQTKCGIRILVKDDE